MVSVSKPDRQGDGEPQFAVPSLRFRSESEPKKLALKASVARLSQPLLSFFDGDGPARVQALIILPFRAKLFRWRIPRTCLLTGAAAARVPSGITWCASTSGRTQSYHFH
jgi:hypothetical protein